MKTFLAIIGGLVLVVIAAAVGLWLHYRAPDTPRATLVAEYGRPQSRFADLGDGLVIHYLDSGPRDGQPLVLLHGFGDNSFSWDGWTKRLSGRFRILAVDLPGHGLSAAPADFATTPEHYADTLDRWAQKIGLPRFAVGGSSLGGGFAWVMAVRHPARVSHVVLVDAAGWPLPPSDTPLPLAFRLMQHRIGRELIASIDNTPLIREGLRRNTGNPAVITEPFIKRWAALQRAPGNRRILMSMNLGSLVATQEQLATIAVPTLVLWGAVDPILPVDGARRFADAIPGAELIIYPGVGHLPQIEIPDRSAADVESFLLRHPAP